MKTYEILYIIKPNLGEKRYEELHDKFKQLVEKNGGEIIEFTAQGVQDIAETFEGYDKGFYVLCQFKGTPAGLNAIENLFKVEEDLVRYLNIEYSSIFPEQLEPEVAKS